MAVYNGFFDAVQDEETKEYDRAYSAGDFTRYFEQTVGSGVCVHNDPDSFKVRLEGGKAVVSPGYLFIRGYWCRNDADYAIDLPGTGNYAIAAHLNLGSRMIELEARSVAQAYPDSLVLAIVSPTSAEDTRHNTDICGVIDTAGELSVKVEWAVNYIDNEIEGKLAAAEAEINAQSRRLDAKIAEVQAQVDRIAPPPVGSIKFSASKDVGAEWLKCDGSFVSEADYPELVAALGKLTPSGDKFQVVSDGEIGPQITNGVLYGGRLWVYSYSTKKLYGVDMEGGTAIKEIALTSEDAHFNDFLSPTTIRPLCLSIVPHKVGAGAEVFLTQVILDGSIGSSEQDFTKYFLIFSAEFSGAEDTISVSMPFSTAHTAGSTATLIGHIDGEASVPYVMSFSENGVESYRCAVGYVLFSTSYYAGHLEWASGDHVAFFDDELIFSYEQWQLNSQRFSYDRKNNGELICFYDKSNNAFKSFSVDSSPAGSFKASGDFDKTLVEFRKTCGPLNAGGADAVLLSYDKDKITRVILSKDSIETVDISLAPPAARVFVDAAAYLWGKDVYMIFVGTGIIFSRTLEKGSFGYLDTTSVLGTITQFGYLDYSQDEGTLYLLGQDTTNKVKVAKIVLNTLYDYANDGAWLPMLASDGVPAYIKAKEEA